MLQVAARGNEVLMDRLGNKSAVTLHFTRLVEKRWKSRARKDSFAFPLHTRIHDYAAHDHVAGQRLSVNYP